MLPNDSISFVECYTADRFIFFDSLCVQVEETAFDLFREDHKLEVIVEVHLFYLIDQNDEVVVNCRIVDATVWI